MSTPKSFAVIDVLNTQQVHALKKYVLSQVGEDTLLYALFDIAASTRKKRHQCDSIESLIEMYFPEESQKKIGNLLSELYQMIETWMAQDQLKEERYTSDLLVQKWLNKNGLYQQADHVLRGVKKKIEEAPLDVEEAMVTNLALYEHLFSTNPGKYDLKSNDYADMVMAFHEYTIVQSYIYLIELNNREDVAHIDTAGLKERLHHLIGSFPPTALSQLLHTLMEMMEKNEVIAFHALKDVLLQNRLKEHSKLHTIITNYVVRRSMRFWSNGSLKDAKVIYDLANYGMMHGVYFTDGMLATANFHNLIGQLCQASSKQSMIAFVEKWIGHVNTKNSEATRDLAFAQIAFYNHQYKKIHQYIWRSDYDDFNQKNLAQSMYLIACHMDRDLHYDAYAKAMVNSQKYITRNKRKMSAHLYTSYMNLFEFMKAVQKHPKKYIHVPDISPLLYRKWCEYIMPPKKKG